MQICCFLMRLLVQKPSLLPLIVLFSVMFTAEGYAAPTLTIPTTTNVGANMATVVMKSSGAGSGYFTLVNGSNASCGTGAQVQAGQLSTGAIAPYHGSLTLAASTAASYTVRNLSQGSTYTVCFTADSPTGSNLNQTPVSANFTTATTLPFYNPAWSIVGAAGFSNTNATYTSLAFAPDGTPYVAYQDSFYSGKATARKFSGGAWSVVWTGGFTAGQADYVSLAFSPDDIPYVAYRDGSTSGKASVMKYYGGWYVVGSTGSANYYSSDTSLAFAPDGTPHVAFVDRTSGKAMVMKYSGSWSIVGNSGFSAGSAESTSLAFSPDGTPYVAYTDYGNSSKVTVMRYSGGAWNAVGSPGFSTGAAYYTSLAIAPDGTPYVAYQDAANGGKTTVMKFGSGTWTAVGTPGFSAGGVAYISLTIAPDGAPYVAYQDSINSSKATVMKFSGGIWQVVGAAGFTSQAANFISLAIAPDGTPYVAFQDGISKATVMKVIDPYPPMIGGTPSATATIGSPFNFSPTSSWAASFSITGTIPPGLNFNTTNGTLSGTPTTTGTFTNLTISATNRAGTTTLPTFSITVSPPAYNLGIATQGTGSGCVTLSTGGGCISSFSASFTDGTIVTLIPTPSTGSAFSSWSGCDSVSGNQCTVTMTTAKTITATFALTPPTISGTPSTSVTAGTGYSFTPASTNAASFNITNKPSWASFNAATGTLTGTPTNADAGTYANIIISATNSTATASLAPFTIAVALPMPTISGTPSTNVTAGTGYSFTPSATDAASFSIVNKPSWASFNTATGALTGTPTNADAGTYANIIISVTNTAGTAALPAFAITVIAVNNPPTIAGSPTTSTAGGAYYSFTPTASDIDGDSLSFTIINKPGWASFNAGTGALSGTPVAGTYSNIQISVSDGNLTTVLPPFSITVSPSSGSGTPVPVMDGWWLVPGMLAGLGIFARRRKG